MNRRGSVILHVLVTGIIVVLIATAVLRVALMSYIQTAHANSETVQKRGDEGALSRVLAYWSANGACSNAPGYNCGSAGSPGSVGTCACNCTPSNPAVDPPISAAGNFTGVGTCQVTIQGVDTMPAAN